MVGTHHHLGIDRTLCQGRCYPWIGAKCAPRAHFVNSACPAMLKISKVKKEEAEGANLDS